MLGRVEVGNKAKEKAKLEYCKALRLVRLNVPTTLSSSKLSVATYHNVTTGNRFTDRINRVCHPI
jgi:hypothetical protein